MPRRCDGDAAAADNVQPLQRTDALQADGLLRQEIFQHHARPSRQPRRTSLHRTRVEGPPGPEHLRHGVRHRGWGGLPLPAVAPQSLDWILAGQCIPRRDTGESPVRPAGLPCPHSTNQRNAVTAPAHSCGPQHRACWQDPVPDKQLRPAGRLAGVLSRLRTFRG